MISGKAFRISSNDFSSVSGVASVLHSFCEETFDMISSQQRRNEGSSVDNMGVQGVLQEIHRQKLMGRDNAGRQTTWRDGFPLEVNYIVMHTDGDAASLGFGDVNRSWGTSNQDTILSSPNDVFFRLHDPRGTKFSSVRVESGAAWQAMTSFVEQKMKSK